MAVPVHAVYAHGLGVGRGLAGIMDDAPTFPTGQRSAGNSRDIVAILHRELREALIAVVANAFSMTFEPRCRRTSASYSPARRDLPAIRSRGREARLGMD
jgi:hypothetical protein